MKGEKLSLSIAKEFASTGAFLSSAAARLVVSEREVAREQLRGLIPRVDPARQRMRGGRVRRFDDFP